MCSQIFQRKKLYSQVPNLGGGLNSVLLKMVTSYLQTLLVIIRGSIWYSTDVKRSVQMLHTVPFQLLECLLFSFCSWLFSFFVMWRSICWHTGITNAVLEPMEVMYLKWREVQRNKMNVSKTHHFFQLLFILWYILKSTAFESIGNSCSVGLSWILSGT